ncbi:MAG: hypothetical protein FJ087_09235 [Deltaproteobacteria bacterium]|nr:hypothetical protein [Deltaproteobacteria bacterium]
MGGGGVVVRWSLLPWCVVPILACLALACGSSSRGADPGGADVAPVEGNAAEAGDAEEGGEPIPDAEPLDEAPGEGNPDGADGVAADAPADAPGDAPADGPEPPSVWDEIGLPFPKDFIFKSVFGAGGKVYAVGGGPIAWRLDASGFTDLLPPAAPPVFNGVWASGSDDLWAVGLGGARVHWAGGWGGAGCKVDADCPGGSDCVAAACKGGTCGLDPKPGPGCCGWPSVDEDFDDGTTGPFEVADLYPPASGNGGVVWHAVAHTDAMTGAARYTSAPYALYFGIPDKPCVFDPGMLCPDFDNGKQVGATATTGAIALPAEAGSVTLSFQVLVDGEAGDSYDALEARVLLADGTAETVWRKSDAGGTTDKQFVAAKADLTDWAGRTVRLQFRFDSGDAYVNSGEGAWIDDVLLTSTCGGAPKPVDLPTLHAVSGSGPDHIVAVGAQGLAMAFDGKQWATSGISGPAVFRGICVDPDLGVWAVGPGAMAVRAGADGVFERIRLQSPADLLACARGVVAVGRKGAVVIGSADAAEAVAPLGVSDVEAIDVLPNGSGWAVGSGGLVAEVKAGGHLTALTPLQGGPGLHGVWTEGPKSAWAVGDGGIVARFKGLLWSTQKIPNAPKLRAVHGMGDKVLAVGDDGVAFVLDGGEWTAATTGVEAGLAAVRFTAPDEAWAVGAGGTVLKWTGGAFSVVDVPTSRNLWALAVGADGTLWVAGDGIVATLTGGKWTPMFSMLDGDLRAVHVLAKDDVIAVGKLGSVFRFDGRNWARHEVEEVPLEDGGTQPFTSGLYGVWASKPDDVWVSGEGGTWVHYDGEVWQSYGSGEAVTLRGVHGTSPTRVWMVGGAGTVLFWNGVELVREVSAPVGTLYGVWADPAGNAYAVGDTGTFLKRRRIPRLCPPRRLPIHTCRRRRPRGDEEYLTSVQPGGVFGPAAGGWGLSRGELLT